MHGRILPSPRTNQQSMDLTFKQYWNSTLSLNMMRNFQPSGLPQGLTYIKSRSRRALLPASRVGWPWLPPGQLHFSKFSLNNNKTRWSALQQVWTTVSCRHTIDDLALVEQKRHAHQIKYSASSYVLLARRHAHKNTSHVRKLIRQLHKDNK